MYIDTRTKETMEKFICEYFGVAIKELEKVFFKIYYAENNEQELIFREFLNGKKIFFDEILFFHFSRRLNTEKDDYRVDNLYDLLIKENPMSEFLRKNDIVFTMGEKHLELYHHGKHETFEKVYGGNVSNVKWRMGYFEGQEDYCVNGFALKDLIYKNSYARELFWGPEFINQVLQVIGREDVLEKYGNISTYYCLEYKVPIEKVIFDGHDKMSTIEKCEYLILMVLKRLYDYYVSNIEFMYDHENPCLRLLDNDIMDSKYFVSKEEITVNMLR